MPRSNFSPTGLDIGENNTNMTYLYGISDFFHVMFEDTSRVNLLLEASSEVASEAYSRFLQLTSTISLEDIQKTLSQPLKLVTIKSSDEVLGEQNLYKISEKIITSRYIANRPLLPTALFEEGVDYRIETMDDGSTYVRFAKDITNAGFSTRLLADQVTKEYALWFVDTEIDERWISTHYAGMIGVDPATSSEAFKNFIYGLYYIYIQGPTLEMLRKGLNLCLGIPLARSEETVLEIRKYLETDQYIVITDVNQYLIPYGLDPSVEEGDFLVVGDELARQVEVKDYINDGEWWINLMVPPTIIPNLPEGQLNRYASKGSHFDQLMRNYLKKHTFLVNVKVQDFKNNQIFSQLSDIIKRAKPSYTQAVYIWTIPRLEETISLEEEMFTQRRDQGRCELVTYPIEKFYRGNSTDPVDRACPTFMRTNVPHWVDKLGGTDEYTNGNLADFGGGVLTGFINANRQYRENTPLEKAWIRTLLCRGSEITVKGRGKLGFFRKSTYSDNSGLPVHRMHRDARILPNMRIIPLYITTYDDVVKKCNDSFIEVPSSSLWMFDLMNPNDITEDINALAINEGPADPNVNQLTTYFDIWKSRGTDVHYLSNVIPRLGFETYTIPSISHINAGDFILGVRVFGNAVGIYWVTSNTSLEVKSYFPVEENDQLSISINSAPTRGMGPTSSSYYLTRGRGRIDYNNVISGINEATINGETVNNGAIVTQYTDKLNTISREMLRNGAPLAHKMELK